jgi:hypothetical protein
MEIDGCVKVGVAGFGDSESSSDVLICHRQVMEGEMLASEDSSQATIVAIVVEDSAVGIDRL